MSDESVRFFPHDLHVFSALTLLVGRYRASGLQKLSGEVLAWYLSGAWCK